MKPHSMRPGDAQTSPQDLHGELNARFHGPLMAFFLRRLKDRSQAEDLTQEVLLRVIAAAHMEQVERVDSFVFKIAINLLRDQKRRVARDGWPGFVPIDDALAGEMERQLVEDKSPERVLLDRDSLFDVLRTLDELGERTRNIFVLFRLENMKQKDIAALYGIAQSTVEKHVMKAVLHLTLRYRRNVTDP
jgi:RNA polymerase sigma factor (sigma-70 family)